MFQQQQRTVAFFALTIHFFFFFSFLLNDLQHNHSLDSGTFSKKHSNLQSQMKTNKINELISRFILSSSVTFLLSHCGFQEHWE